MSLIFGGSSFLFPSKTVAELASTYPRTITSQALLSARTVRRRRRSIASVASG